MNEPKGPMAEADAGMVKGAAPRLWEFKGHALRDTFFELRIFGQPNAKALSNIIKQLEVTRDFVAEDENATPTSTSRTDLEQAQASPTVCGEVKS